MLGNETWDGFNFVDTIQPCFLFIVGLTITFSLERYLENKLSLGKNNYKSFIQIFCFLVWFRLAKRVIILLGFGIFFNFLEIQFSEFKDVDVTG